MRLKWTFWRPRRAQICNRAFRTCEMWISGQTCARHYCWRFFQDSFHNQRVLYINMQWIFSIRNTSRDDSRNLRALSQSSVWEILFTEHACMQILKYACDLRFLPQISASCSETSCTFVFHESFHFVCNQELRTLRETRRNSFVKHEGIHYQLVARQVSK